MKLMLFLRVLEHRKLKIMKIRRFRYYDGIDDNLKPKGVHSYAYIWANFCERLAIDKMIKDGRVGIRKHPYRSSVYDAHYILVKKV